MDIEELLDDHETGLYTAGEVVSLCIEEMARNPSDALWASFPDWVKDRTIAVLADFSPNDEVVAWGARDSDAVKNGLLRARAWLTDRKII